MRKNKRGHTKVKFSPTERAAMDREIEDQLLDFVAKNLLEIEAMIMVQLREQLGFGKKRLKRFYMGFSPNIYDFTVRNLKYRSGGKPKTDIERLEEYGCNLEEWAIEREAAINEQEKLKAQLKLLTAPGDKMCGCDFDGDMVDK
jgi:hypothetical protein